MSEDSTPDQDIKRSKLLNERNEISSSLSSSQLRKRTAARFEDHEEAGEDETDAKKLKSDVSSLKSQVSTPSNIKAKLNFSKDLSPKKLLKKHLTLTSNNEDDSAAPKETKEIYNDAKALEADQKKSEERGQKLLEAFDDD